MPDPTEDGTKTFVSRRQLLSTAGASGVALAAGCAGNGGGNGNGGNGNGNGGGGNGNGNGDGSGGDGSGDDAVVSAAWIYFADAGDQGWTASHDGGRQATVEAMDDLESDFVENVDAANVEQTASQYAEQGFDIVFGASASFTDPMAAASEQYPETAFEVASGIDTGENYGSYYVKLYHARYLVGYAAGMLTENDSVGYVAANPVSTVYQDINAFASGLADANADATLYLRWTNAWYDPPTEGENAQTLIDDEDVDVMAQHQDSAAAIETAAENGIWGSGYAQSMSEFAGENYLMTPVFNWEETYVPLIEAARDGEWEAGMTFPGIGEGAAALSEPGPEVPEDVLEEVMGIRDEMIDGDADEIVWSGTPYADRTDEEILFGSDTLGLDNIDGDEL
ncbi:BMP family ABC transporter substrate-binding protein [Natronomonas sp.]|uniref:BMP family ABC transporter substrate-binding protein n=1 Tax=Natronomonas sp. TaxID=2184060 RepID=UPI002612A20D|nr:BMP family ABC transporter substrate-binding protein [Natronomonas sp.]